MKTKAKISKLYLPPYSPYSPDLAPSEFIKFGPQRDLLVHRYQKSVIGGRIESIEEMVVKTKAYFVTKFKSFCKNCIEMFVLLLKESMLMNEARFCQKVSLGNLVTSEPMS